MRKSTEIQRRLRALSPIQPLRQEYEDISAGELIEALHDLRSIPEDYLRIKENLETSLLAVEDARAPEARRALDQAREAFSECLERWQQGDGARRELMELLDERRRN